MAAVAVGPPQVDLHRLRCVQFTFESQLFMVVDCKFHRVSERLRARVQGREARTDPRLGKSEMPDGDAAPEQERPAAGEEAEVAKDDAMEVDGGAKESEEQGGGDGKTGLSSDSEDDEPAEGETKAPAQNNAAEGKTGLSDSSEDEESGEKQASAMAGEKAGSGEGGASEKAPLTKKDVFGSDDSSDEEESGAPKVPGQKVTHP
jgi:hypothetical protein